MQLAILAADFTPGEADALRRAMAAWKRKGGLGPFHDAAGRPHGRQRLHARVRRAHLQADRGLRRIRLPGEPRRQFCAAGVCQRMDQAPPSRCVPGRAAEQPADGLLRTGATGARCARARRAGAAGGCAEQRNGPASSRCSPVRARTRCARCVWASTGCWAFRRRPPNAWWPRARRARSTTSRISRAARHSMPARCSCCRRPMHCGRSLATATRPPGASPASTPAPPRCWRNTRTHEAAGRARGTDGRRGTAGRLPQHRPVAHQPSAGAAARAV